MPPTLPTGNFDRDIGALQATVSMLADAMKEQASLHDKAIKAQQEQYTQVIKDLRDMVADANRQIKELKDEIAAMKSLIDQAKGGWKILVGVGTISAAVGAFLTKIFTAVWTFPK